MIRFVVIDLKGSNLIVINWMINEIVRETFLLYSDSVQMSPDGGRGSILRSLCGEYSFIKSLNNNKSFSSAILKIRKLSSMEKTGGIWPVSDVSGVKWLVCVKLELVQ